MTPGLAAYAVPTPDPYPVAIRHLRKPNGWPACGAYPMHAYRRARALVDQLARVNCRNCLRTARL